MDSVILATDGSCLRRSGPGGWAAILQSPAGEAVYVGNAGHTTSNRMELTALLRGLQALAAFRVSHPLAVTVLTDNEVIALGLNGDLARWAAHDWCALSTHKPLKDRDLWQAIAAAVVLDDVHATWNRAHRQRRLHRLNQHADALARSAALFADRQIRHPEMHWLTVS